MIYLIFDTQTKQTKIGKSNAPEERLKILRTGNPNVKLIYYTDKVTESELHVKYASLRTSGEWFKLKVEHLKEIIGSSKNIPKTLFYRSTIKRLSTNEPIKNMKEKTEIIYNFKHAPEIYADSAGNFFRYSDAKPIRKIYHAGRIAVRDKNRIYGIKKLRSTAIKTTRQISECPF